VLPGGRLRLARLLGVHFEKERQMTITLDRPLAARLAATHAADCECSLCDRYLGETGDLFVDSVVDLLRKHGLEASGNIEAGGACAKVTAKHPYGLTHSIRFYLPRELGQSVWGHSLSGTPVNIHDIASRLYKRVRTLRRESEE